MKEGRYTK